MKNSVWFVHNRKGGRHRLGPMEYQPLTWQGFLVATVFGLIGFLFTGLIFTFVQNIVLAWICVLLMLPFLQITYNLLASFLCAKK